MPRSNKGSPTAQASGSDSSDGEEIDFFRRVVEPGSDVVRKGWSADSSLKRLVRSCGRLWTRSSARAPLRR
jgi:hypothetical protein